MVSVCLSAAPVCRALPGPPGPAVDWTLVFGAAGLDCGAQSRAVSLCQVVLRGGLQLVEVLQQSSVLLLLLLQSSEDTHCHLQDVCFLQLGVWLLFEELWSQERLELLDAAVDSLSAKLLHQRLSEQQDKKKKKKKKMKTLVVVENSEV